MNKLLRRSFYDTPYGEFTTTHNFLYILMFILSTILGGYVVSYIWNNTGIFGSTITIYQAILLDMVVSFMGGVVNSKPKTFGETAERILGRPIAFLITGWVIITLFGG